MLHRAPDTSAIEALIGWKTKLSLSDIIKDVADSVKTQVI